MTQARRIAEFSNQLNSDGQVERDGIADKSITREKLYDGIVSNFKNKIINGDISVAQRGVTFAAAVTDTYLVDMFKYQKVSTGVGTFSVETLIPGELNYSHLLTRQGITKCLTFSVTTADTAVAVGDYQIISTAIEGSNLRGLLGAGFFAYNNPFTLSFWVKSSVVGIHCVRLMSGNSAEARFIKEYEITLPDVWTKIVIPFPNGLTTNNSWATDNSLGLRISWTLMAGSTFHMSADNWSTQNVNGMCTANQVNCLGTVGNEFSITGVQLESGTAASDYDVRPIAVETALCQRYFNRFPAVVAVSTTYYSISLPVVMRANPTITGGGAGFVSATASPFTISCYQTTRATNTLSMSADII